MPEVTISMEIELGWGVHDIGEYQRLSERREEETRILNALLEKCDYLSLPFTFDIVGHLLLESCQGHHDGPYTDGWFQEDPGTSVNADPLFYAPDLVEDIQTRTTNHEICTHSFSHIDCEEVSTEVVQHDLEIAQQLHKDVMGEKSTSFVPPKHKEAPSGIVKEAGIDTVRTNGDQQNLGLFRKFVQMVLGPTPTFDPETKDGITMTYCSSYPSLVTPMLPKGPRVPHPAFRFLPLPKSVRKKLHLRYLKKSVEEAIRTDTSVHFWCHLYDLANDEQLSSVLLWLEYLSRMKKENKIEVVTMKNISENNKNNVDL